MTTDDLETVVRDLLDSMEPADAEMAYAILSASDPREIMKQVRDYYTASSGFDRADRTPRMMIYLHIAGMLRAFRLSTEHAKAAVEEMRDAIWGATNDGQ